MVHDGQRKCKRRCRCRSKGIDEPDRLAEVGDPVVDGATGSEVLARAARM